MFHKILIGSMMLVLLLPNVYAQQDINLQYDHYEDKGFRLVHNPTICAFEPHEDQDIPNVPQKMLDMTEHAVLDWKTKLNAGARHSEWDMTLIKVMQNQQGFDENKCNIGVFYSPSPNGTINNSEPVGVTYFNQPEQHKATIVIYYLKINVDQNPYFVNSLATDAQLNMALDHELGHALGLDHYQVSPDEQDRILSGTMDMPSIMIPYVIPIGVNHYSITQMDVNQLKSLYNYQGFGSYSSSTPKIEQLPSSPSGIEQHIIINADKYVYHYGDHMTLTIRVSKVIGGNATVTFVTNGIESKGFTIPITDFQTSITSPFAIDETNSVTGSSVARLYYDNQTSVTSFIIVGNSQHAQPTHDESSSDSLPSPSIDGNVITKLDVPSSLKVEVKHYFTGDLGDGVFEDFISYLERINAVKHPTITTPVGTIGNLTIPSWFKNDAKMWYQGDISDTEFVNTIKYMIDTELIEYR